MAKLLNQYLPQSQVPQRPPEISSSTLPLLEKLVGEVSGIQGQVTVIQELLMRISENLQGFSDKDSHQEVLGDQDSPSAQPPTPTKHVQINSLDQPQIQSQQAHHATTDSSGLFPPPSLSNPSVKESDTRTSRRGQRPKRPIRNVSSRQT